MTETLGLVGDGDEIDLVEDIESAFGIMFSNEEAESCLTVGDAFDLIKGWFQTSDGSRCVTAMAFYRVRRALGESGRNLRPESSLPTGQSAKSLLNELAARSGLRFPRRNLTWVGGCGLLLILAGFFATVVLLDARPDYWWVGAVAFCLGVFAVTVDPCVLPDGCETVGGLSRKVAALNFGKLVGDGARPTDRDVWAALVSVLADYTTAPASEIKPDMHFIRAAARRDA